MSLCLALHRHVRRPFHASARGFLPLALVVASAQAQPASPTTVPDTLDLKTAIGFAIENNFAIRQARERIRQQEGVVIEVRAREIPNVSADAAYQLNDKDLSQGLTRSHQAWQVNLTASQILYSGGGVRSAVRSAKLVRDAALLDLQVAINDALLQVRTGFFAVLLAREKIKVQESNLELLQQQLKTTTDRFQAGTISSFERLRAEVAVANAKAPLIAARNDYRLAIEALRQALGWVSDKSQSAYKVPEFVGSLAFTPVAFDLQQSFEAARANRPDLQRLAKISEAREEIVTTARSDRYPNVSAFGGYQFRKGVTDSFGSSDHGWLLGLQSQWAIFDGRATAGRVAQARSLVEQSKLQFIETELAAEVEVRRAHSQWQESTELAEVSQKVVEQATEAVRLANARYSAGTGTQLDVLQSQVELTTARTNQIQAYYGYNVAVASLRRAMGLPDDLVTN